MFPPFFVICTCFKYLILFAATNISTILCLITMCSFSFMSACKYAPTISHVATSRFYLHLSHNIVLMLQLRRWAMSLPLDLYTLVVFFHRHMLGLLFSFLNTIAGRASFISSSDRSLKFLGVNTPNLSN